MDWVNNEGTLSDSAKAWLDRHCPPDPVNITMINNNQDCLLSWDEVINCGAPGSPTCYVVYHSDEPSPAEDFLFLATSTDTFYVHENVGLFVEEDQKFYVVTSYGGILRALNHFSENKISFKLGELDEMVSEYYRNNPGIINNPDAIVEEKHLQKSKVIPAKLNRK